MRIIIGLIVYLIFGLPMILNLFKVYKQITADDYNGSDKKWKRASFIIYVIFLIFFLLIFGMVLIFKNLWNISYEISLIMAQISLIITIFFCYSFSKFRNQKTEIDFFITRYILFYTVPFLFLISVLKKII